MESLVKIIESISWPITVLIITFSLKKPIFTLIYQAKKLKYKDFELEFEKELEALNVRVKEKKQEVVIPKGFKNKYFSKELERVPLRGKIIEAWLGLETSVLSTIASLKLSPKIDHLNMVEALRILDEQKIIDKENLEIINDLRRLRNKVVHLIEIDITEDEAQKFLEIARDQTDIILSNIWNKYGGCSN